MRLTVLTFEMFLRQKANEEGSKTYELGRDFTAEGSSHSFDFTYGEQRLEGIALAMAGQHQVANASLAIMASLYCFKKIILK